MQIQKLSLLHFRNYGKASIRFGDGINIIYGENGSGKTSILEAIHYLALTRSFRTTIDKHLILHQKEMLRVQGEFQTSQGQAIRTAIAYSLDTGKQLSVNGQKAQKFSEYIGEVPVVLLYPDDLGLSRGGPHQRRRFLDVVLSQSSKLYLHHLIQYNRSLKQRNQLLSRPHEKPCDPGLLLPWEENLITHGVELIRKRKETAKRLSEMVKAFYCELSHKDDKVKILYSGNVDSDDEQSLPDIYRKLFRRKRSQEQEYGATILGPHRDDLLFLINGKPMKVFASQGEHKTFVIALKLAEFQYLREQRLQSPILLFDDIFGELDASRIQLMLRQLSHIGQVFVTTTSRNFFEKIGDDNLPKHFYHVENGEILMAKA